MTSSNHSQSDCFHFFLFRYGDQCKNTLIALYCNLQWTSNFHYADSPIPAPSYATSNLNHMSAPSTPHRHDALKTNINNQHLVHTKQLFFKPNKYIMILVLQQLYWPSVWQRVEFKLAVLVYKALTSPAPQYLPHTWLPVSVSVCRQLRSSDKIKCSVFRTRSRSRSRLGIVHLQLPAESLQQFAHSYPSAWLDVWVVLRITEDAFRHRNSST